ncbi:hypothetical protein N8J89_31535 [Crossiella sp. CA-258035]|uniref:hypothetical protein n=1 Tax=Crossiella sp. CA-258035 TaxID=2981138 RepID=UPI0024BCF93C|nr:hypothetical protein [Crossiella sp. CA-258035]WHT17626.1 hypothetical protein N8J89_31535 [Crossiella sp. CA-258035]
MAVARVGRAAGLGWSVGVVVNLALGVAAYFPLLFTRMVFSAIAYRLGDFSAFPARDGIDIPIMMAGVCWLLFLPLWFLANRFITLWAVVPVRPYWLVAVLLPGVLFLADTVFALRLFKLVF